MHACMRICMRWEVHCHHLQVKLDADGNAWCTPLGIAPDKGDPDKQEDEELYGMHDMPALSDCKSGPEDSDVSASMGGRVSGEGTPGHKRMRARRMHGNALVACDDDVSMSDSENSGRRGFGGEWSDRRASDSGTQRGACCALLCIPLLLTERPTLLSPAQLSKVHTRDRCKPIAGLRILQL